MSTISLFSVLNLLVLQVHSIPSYFSNIHYDLHSIVHRVIDSLLDECRSGGRVDRSVEVISWEPTAVIYHNFLSKDECEHVIKIAKPHMKKATIIERTGRRKREIEDTWFRNCSITSLERGQDETIGAIEKRIADLTFLPVEYGEGLQVLHYEVGQKFGTHHDYRFNKDQGHRVATVVIYLSDVEEGGETIFPHANGNISALACWNKLSKAGGLSVKPKMGDALLFWNIEPDGTKDPSSVHGSCPVIKGSKWSATKWIRAKEFNPKV